MKTIIKQGDSLTSSELAVINEWRIKEFNVDKLWEPSNIEMYNFRKMFLVYEGDELVSFGNLRPLEISFLGEKLSVLGVAAVVSIVKGNGYGRTLMKSMTNYALENKMIIIGFCEEKNIGFYEKTGFCIVRSGGSRIVYKDDEMKEYPYENPDDVLIIFDSESKFIENISLKPDELITIYS